MASNQLDISVVLCAYTQDRWNDLQHAIHSIQNQTVPPRQIILVIDHNPGLLRLARETFRAVEVIENQETPGLSGARNSGIGHATGEIIAFMDEDAVAEQNWLECLVQGYQDSRVIGVGGLIKPHWSVSKPDWFPEEFNWVVGCSYTGLPTTPAPVRNLLGCNMSFRREVFSYTGGFRHGIGRIGVLPVGCEETELCIRARQRKSAAVLLFTPDAKVYHNVPEWRAGWSYFARRCYAEGLSKALVTHFVGSTDGLSSERRYVFGTLPRGVLSGLSQSISKGRLEGLKRAAAIVAGLSLTALGYLVGVVTHMVAKNAPTLGNQKVPPQIRGFGETGFSRLRNLSSEKNNVEIQE